MEELRNEIRKVIASAKKGAELEQLIDSFLSALSAHPEHFQSLTGRYRLQTTDTGLHAAFSLGADGLIRLSPDEAADLTISAKEKHLLALIRRELNPMTAMMTGKIRIKGNMQLLTKFAQLL